MRIQWPEHFSKTRMGIISEIFKEMIYFKLP